MSDYPNPESLNLLDESLNQDNTLAGNMLAREGLAAAGDPHTHKQAEGSESGRAVAMQFVQAATESAHLVAPHAAAIQQVRSGCNCSDSHCSSTRQNMIHKLRLPADQSPMSRFSDLGYDANPQWS